jgi:hypothetical protein
MHATKRTGRRGQPRHYYVCTTHRVRGDQLCTNAASAHMAALDTAWIDALRAEVFTADLVDDVIDRAVQLRQEAVGCARHRPDRHRWRACNDDGAPGVTRTPCHLSSSARPSPW